MSKMSCPILYSKLLYKIGPDFLEKTLPSSASLMPIKFSSRLLMFSSAMVLNKPMFVSARTFLINYIVMLVWITIKQSKVVFLLKNIIQILDNNIRLRILLLVFSLKVFNFVKNNFRFVHSVLWKKMYLCSLKSFFPRVF